MTIRKLSKKPLKKPSSNKKGAKASFSKKPARPRKGKAPRGKGPLKKGRSLNPRKAAVKKAAPKKPSVSSRENPAGQALARRIANLLVEKKATDVLILNVMGKTSYTDFVVIASADSDRQVSALAEYVETTLKQEGGHRTLGSEGQQGGNWVLLDYGDVVAHLFLADTRSFYDLEGLWTDAPRERVA